MAGGPLELLVGVAGIYATFLYYGSLQEDVLTFKAENGDKFKFSWFLQVLEAVANVVLGFLCMVVFEGVRMVPQVPYLVSGSLQVSAKYFTTASMVSGVSFPVATLAKSSKMVPVMIGSLLLGKANYSVREYFQVLLIVGGTALVSMAGKSKPGKENSMLGLAFLCAALACDGVVGGTQKGMKKALAEKGLKERNFEMQFLTNFYMAITAVVFTIVFGEYQPGVDFLYANPGVMNKIMWFAGCSALGQAFIFFVISNFDPLVCTTVTTTRKVFSVLLSVFTKGHSLDTQGWAGITVACAGILGELQHKVSAGTKKKSGAKEDKKEDKKAK